MAVLAGADLADYAKFEVNVLYSSVSGNVKSANTKDDLAIKE